MSTGSHAALAPSSAARNVMCPGSRKMALLFPDEDTQDAADGDAAHWAGAELLRGQQVAVGQVSPNGVTLTDEMVDAAEMWHDHITQRGPVGYVETLFHNDALHATDNGGTPDHISAVVVGSVLHLFVDDFKFGHDYVNVFRNWQLMNYAALILHAWREQWPDDRNITVTMTIVQPRNYHRDGPIRTWTVNASELRGFFNVMFNQYAISMRDDAPVHADDPDICKNCTGRHACEAATAASWNAVSLGYKSTPLNMSPAALGLETRILRRAAKQIAARLDGLEQQVLSTISRHGRDVPGFAIDHGSARTVWAREIKDVVAMGKMFGVDVAKESALTPTQAIAAGKKIPGWPEVVKGMSNTPSGAAKLVEVDAQYAARIFTKE